MTRRRGWGLRGRLLVALVATSALTLAAAAAALLPPLQDRLRTQRADDLQAATQAEAGAFERALRDALRSTSGEPPSVRRLALEEAALRRALILRQRTGARVLVTDSVPQTLYDTDNDSPLPQQPLLRALIEEFDIRDVGGGNVTVVVQLVPFDAGRVQPAYRRFLLATQQPFTAVDAAVAQVRTAFLTAAGIGLLVAVVLGVALSTTLSRRLARLRAGALRVTAEGAYSPAPRDDGRDEVGDLARTLAAMQEKLRRQEEARRAFVATASHELRTPLTSLQGTLELLAEDLADGRVDVADAQEQVAGAQSQLRRLSRLATELLDLSRLDAAVPLRSEPVELGELSRAVAAEFELVARERGVGIVIEPPPGPCWAAGDPGAVARVVRILLDNALRFSPPGESVVVTPSYHGDRATVEVSDRGPGVAPEDRERIFERFHRGSPTSATSGFGLGLAIGRELAQRMDGSLELHPATPGERGARFSLRLPIELPAGSHHADQSAEAARRGREPGGEPDGARRGARSAAAG